MGFPGVLSDLPCPRNAGAPVSAPRIFSCGEFRTLAHARLVDWLRAQEAHSLVLAADIVEWAEVWPMRVVIATPDQAWEHRPRSGDFADPFAIPMNGPGDPRTTERLLDAAIALATTRSVPVTPPVDESEWAWRLSGLYRTTHATPRVMAAAAKRFEALGQQVLAAWARTKVREEHGHDQLALRDLRALGYEAEALVEMFTPRRAAALVQWFEAAVFESDEPLGCVGYAYTLERLALERSVAYVEAVERVVGPRRNATRCLRVHSAAGSDAAHVEEIVKLVATLPAAVRARIAADCHATARIIADPQFDERAPTLRELSHLRISTHDNEEPSP